MKVLVLVLDHEVLVLILVLNIWSWSCNGLGLEENVLQSFKTFVVILDGSEQGTPRHFVRDNKGSLPFGSHCLRESSALHPHQPQLRGYLTMGAICYNHTDASKAQLHRLWKLLSLGSNKSGKQQFSSRVEMSSRKMPHCRPTYEESGIPSTRTTYKKAKLDEVLAAHCRADLVTECMKKKKTLILSGDFRFRFRPKMNVDFRFRS